MSTWTLQCSPVAIRIYSRLAATRTKKRPFSGNKQDYLEASNRRAGLFLHASFGLWMKTQPFHLEVIISYISSGIYGSHMGVISARCVRKIRNAKLKLLGKKSRVFIDNETARFVPWLKVVKTILICVSEWRRFYRLYYLCMCASRKRTLSLYTYIVTECIRFHIHSLMRHFDVCHLLVDRNAALIKISCTWVRKLPVLCIKKKSINALCRSRDRKYRTWESLSSALIWKIIDDLQLFNEKELQS